MKLNVICTLASIVVLIFSLRAIGALTQNSKIQKEETINLDKEVSRQNRIFDEVVENIYTGQKLNKKHLRYAARPESRSHLEVLY